jgi:fumarate reductase flavoprotein subunit
MAGIDIDLAIVGGGPAGMSAAITAAERGASVIVFEKADHTGGASNGGLGPFAVESRLQIQQKHKFSREDALNFFMEHTRWRVDPRLVKAYVDKSADTIDWLEKLGVRFVNLVAYFPGAQFTWHQKDFQSPGIVTLLTEHAVKLGVKIFLEMAVQKIKKDAGRVSGLIALDKTGEQIKVNAKAVVVATGGLGDNPEMIKKYTGLEWGKDLYSMRVPGLTGDGLRMAWEAGAARTEIFMDTYSSLPQPYGGPEGTMFELASFRYPVLMVNQGGERFCNEEVSRNVALAANMIRTQQNCCAIRIFDEDTRIYLERYEKKYFGNDTSSLPEIIRKAHAGGYGHLFMAGSIEELATQAGIDKAVISSTIAEYNRACGTGRDDLFFKEAKDLNPVQRPPFYGARFYLGGYGSLGGIKINHRVEVLDNNFDVIPGLYAAGTDANSIYGDTYPFALSGNTSGFAYNTGRIAGENAAHYIKTINK